MRESAWLIEANTSWWLGCHVGEKLSESCFGPANDAVRFSRKQDADIVLYHFMSGQVGLRSTEHVWMDDASARDRLREALKEIGDHKGGCMSCLYHQTVAIAALAPPRVAENREGGEK